MTTRVYKGLAVVLILLATLFVYQGLFGLWFTDIDTFPLISSGGIDSMGAFVDVLTSPLMQGLMPNAQFYRPLASISWGIDASIWGLNPLGYHLTDLAIHIANSLLLFFLVRGTALRLSADNSPDNSRVTQNDITALAAALIFAIHPIAMDVVPAIARRADLLYGLFLLLTLRSLHKALIGQWVQNIGLATFFCLLAFASKDSALILPGIAMAFVFCFTEATTIQRRVTQCLRACWPMIIAAAFFLGARTLVLGGIGGYAEIEGWAHLGFAEAISGSIRPLLCTIFMSGNLDTCINVPRTWLLGVATIVCASFVLISFRVIRGNVPYPPLRLLAFAILSLLALLILHGIAGTPALIRTVYTALLFISIAMGWGFAVLPQAILARGKMRDSLISERAVHAVAGIILILATGSILRGAASGQAIDEWHTGTEAEKLAFTDLLTGLESVPPNSVVYLVNIPFRAKFLNRDLPMRDHPMPLEHSIQGFVNLAFPDKHLEVIALSYVKISVRDPAAVASTISFQPETAHLDIQTGPEGYPIRRIWIVSYPRISPWRDNTYSRAREAREKGRLSIDLNPEVALEERAVFFVYTGGRVVRREITPWVVEHVPVGN